MRQRRWWLLCQSQCRKMLPLSLRSSRMRISLSYMNCRYSSLDQMSPYCFSSNARESLSTLLPLSLMVLL